MKKIVIASHNPGKILEIQGLLQDYPLNLQLQSDLDVSSVEETGLTFIENAILKARHAAKYTELPALADDSGLVVEALSGRPGIYSARYAGEEANASQNIGKVLQEMKNVPWEKRNAYFYTVMIFLEHKNDPRPKIFEGVWYGKILFEPQASNGFGYDPLFYVPTHDCSAAALSIEEKNKISHRGQALAQFKRFMSALMRDRAE